MGGIARVSQIQLLQPRAGFANQPLVQLFLQCMKVADVARGIFALCVIELGRAPVAGLLLFRDFRSQQLADEVLEAVPVGVGAHQARGRARAIERRGHEPEIGLDHRHIESGEMVELQPPGVGEERLQIGRGVSAPLGEPHEMLVAAPVGQLNDAQPVAARVKAHRLGIDGNRAVGEADAALAVMASSEIPSSRTEPK